MAFFEVHWRSSIKKDLRTIPSHDVARIISAVESLSIEPFPYGSEKLAGSARSYRIRIGDYRVIYDVIVETRQVQIQRVRHRKDAYR